MKQQYRRYLPVMGRTDSAIGTLLLTKVSGWPRQRSMSASLFNPGKFAQPGEQARHFVFGVVMHQADTQEPASGLHAETFREIQGIEVTVPGEDSAFAEKRSDLSGSMTVQANGNGGAALRKAVWICDSKDANPRDSLQTRE